MHEPKVRMCLDIPAATIRDAHNCPVSKKIEKFEDKLAYLILVGIGEENRRALAHKEPEAKTITKEEFYLVSSKLDRLAENVTFALDTIDQRISAVTEVNGLEDWRYYAKRSED